MTGYRVDERSALGCGTVLMLSFSLFLIIGGRVFNSVTDNQEIKKLLSDKHKHAIAVADTIGIPNYDVTAQDSAHYARFIKKYIRQNRETLMSSKLVHTVNDGPVWVDQLDPYKIGQDSVLSKNIMKYEETIVLRELARREAKAHQQ